MNSSSLNLNNVKLIKAEKDNESHKKGLWLVFNENIEFFHLTKNPVPYEDHCKWWEDNFQKEFIYLIFYETEICGYIRLTKERTSTKEKNEISIALSKKFQNLGIGTYAYKIFEGEMKKIGISEIIANTNMNNKGGVKFFEHNDFRKSYIKFIKKL